MHSKAPGTMQIDQHLRTLRPFAVAASLFYMNCTPKLQ